MDRIGNRLAVSMEALRSVCQKTHAAAVDALSSSKTSLAVAHNAYLTHTLLGIFLATAGRPVNDPFHTIDLFNLEEGLGILIDKVSDRSKEARLVVMPQEAVRQLRHWLVHLQALAARLSREHRELAAQIYAIAQPGFGRAIPLFFMLKDDLSGIKRIGLKEYQAMLQPYWTLPANFQRACLLSWLREHGCLAELVDMQLGHASAGNTPFGLATAQDPLEVRDILRPYLDRYLTATGWQSLPGLVSTRVRCSTSVLKLAQRLKTDHGLGPGSRAAARKILWARDAQFVTNLLQQYFPAAFDEHNPGGLPAGFPREIGDETVRQIVDSIFEPADGGEERTLLRFQLLRRYLARLRRHGVRVTLPGRMVAINPEPAPFNAETLVLAGRAESLRQRFIEYLEQQGKLGKAPEPAQRVAEILIAAPLFSALQSRRALEALPVALQNATYYWDETLFIDLSLGERDNCAVRRWFPDALCSVLILGFRQLRDKDLSLDPESLIDALGSLLKELGVNVPGLRRRRVVSYGDLLKLLAPVLQWACAYWRLRLPGSLRRYAEDDVLCASLPLSAWVRLTSQRPLHSQRRNSERSVAESEVKPLLSTLREHDRSDSKQGRSSRAFWKDFEAMLSPRQKVSGKRGHAWHLGQLASNLRQLIMREAGQASWAALAVADWGVALCLHGTRFQERLATSTVAKYLRTIGRPLIDLAGDTRFLDLSAIGFTAIYSNVVASKNRDVRHFVAGRLEEFHHHLMFQYGVADADWSEIYPDDSPERRVDAGVLTENEYLTALNLLRTDSWADERNRHAAALFILLAYRFGLRSGEISRLLRRDIQQWGEEVVLIVNNNIYGETKTRSGVRQVLLLESLSEVERTVLNQWLESVDTFSDGDLSVALFGERNNLKTRIDLVRIAARVTEALFACTGNPDVRVHHLRHSYANRLYLASIGGDDARQQVNQCLRRLSATLNPAAVRRRLTGRPERSRRMNYATSVAMGHGGPQIALESYIHLADICLADQLRQQKPTELRDHALTYGLSQGGSTLRVTRLRLKKKCLLRSEDYTHGHLLTSFAERQAWPDLASLLAPKPSIPELPAPAMTVEAQRFEPSDLDRLLSLVRLRKCHEGLAEAFHLDEETIDTILSQASAVEKISGFTLFGVGGDHDPEWGSLDLKGNRQQPLPSGFRAARFLRAENVRAAMSKYPDDLKTFTELWMNAYHPDSPLLFDSPAAATKFVKAARAIGFDETAFEQSRPTDLSATSPLAQVLPWQTLPPKTRLPFRQDKMPIRRRTRIAVGLDRKASPIPHRGTLNRIAFVLAVWVRLGSQETPTASGL